MNNKTISAAPCLEGLSLQWHRMTKFQKKVIVLLFLGGCLCMTAAFLTKKHRSPIAWDGTVFEIDRVNPLDAALAHAYNSTIDNIADGFVFVVNALVVVGLCLRVFQKGGKAEAFAQFFYDGYTFILSWMYTSSFFRLLKTFAGRIRPYMYFPNPSEKGVLEGDFYRSWPSGHSASAMLAASFLLCWVLVRKIDAKFQKRLAAVVLLLALVTMTLRVLSGNHFLTDVISGGVLGFASGSAVFLICNRIAGRDFA